MSHRFSPRRAAVMAAALLLAASVSPLQAVEPEVLKQVPADAYAVVVVNNVRTLANRVSNAAARLQAQIPPDLIGAATRSMGIDEGFDANSSAALIFLKPAADKEGANYFDGTPPAVILLPTTNSKAMLENYKPTDPDKDGISQVTLPQSPEEKGYVAVVDKKWIAYAQKREDMVSYLARGDSFVKAAAPETLKVFDANDLVVWGNVEKLGKGIDKVLEDRHTDLSGMMDLQAFNNRGDAYTMAMQKQTLNLAFNFTKQFFMDAKASMVTVRLTDSGATVGLVGDFKADSQIGNFIASQAGRGPVTLKGLPEGNFLMAGTMHWNSASMADMVGAIGDQILGDPAIAKSPRATDLKKTFEASKQMLGIMQGMNMVFMEPPEGGKNGFLVGAALLETSDPKKLLDMQIASAKDSIAQGALGEDFKATMDVVPAALTVKEVSLARMSMKIALREETVEKPLAPESRMAFEMLQRIYGPNGVTVHMGVVGKKVLVVYGNDPAFVEAAVSAAVADSDALSGSEGVTAVKNDVVANPVVVAYLPIARWVTLAQTIIAPGVASPAPAASITNSPPVIMSAGVTGKMLTAEVHVPVASITGIQEAVSRLQRAMNGGGGGAGPNLP